METQRPAPPAGPPGTPRLQPRDPVRPPLPRFWPGRRGRADRVAAVALLGSRWVAGEDPGPSGALGRGVRAPACRPGHGPGAAPLGGVRRAPGPRLEAAGDCIREKLWAGAGWVVGLTYKVNV